MIVVYELKTGNISYTIESERKDEDDQYLVQGLKNNLRFLITKNSAVKVGEYKVQNGKPVLKSQKERQIEIEDRKKAIEIQKKMVQEKNDKQKEKDRRIEEMEKKILHIEHVLANINKRIQ